MSRRSLAWCVLLACGCGGGPAARPPAPLPDPPDGPAPAMASAPATEWPKLSAEDEAFWFGTTGAPAAIASGQPLAAVPGPEADGAYRLGPGDVVEFRVPEVKDLSREEITVAPDGTLSLDLVGAIHVSGRTAADVTAEVSLALGRFYRRATPQVALKRARVREVVVVGAVAQGGRRKLAGRETLLDVLGDAGYGGKPEHLRGSVSVLRGSRALNLPTREVLALTDPRWNLRLLPDDAVVVHTEDPALVAGEVRRPGAIPFPAQGGIPLIHAITLAGGITEEADLAHARIARADGRAEEVDLNRVLFGGANAGPLPAPLGPGDALSIPASRQTRVYVFGMVDRPGLFRQSGPMRLIHALAQANPKQFGAVFDDAKLVRGWPDHPEVTRLDLDALLFKHDAAWNVELRDGDVVYIPETAASDALDFLGRMLAPVASTGTASGQTLTGIAALENASKK